MQEAGGVVRVPAGQTAAHVAAPAALYMFPLGQGAHATPGSSPNVPGEQGSLQAPLHDVTLTRVANPGAPFWNLVPPLSKPACPSQKTKELFVKELPPAPPTAWYTLVSVS